MPERSPSLQKVHTSVASEQHLNRLQEATGLPFTALCRMGMLLSLAEAPDLDIATFNDEGGRELNRYSLLGDVDLLIRSLVVLGKGWPLTEEEIIKRHIKARIDHGVGLMHANLAAVGSPQEFLAQFASRSPSERAEAGVPQQAGGLRLATIGEEVGTGTPVIAEFNHALRSANPHMAIVGIPGVGKTQMLLKILADLVHDKDDGLPAMIFLDYKGDVSANDAFLRTTRAKCYRLPHNQLPINPFILDDYSKQQIKLSGEEKAESFSSFQKLGPIQRGNLSRAIEAVYANRQSREEGYPDFKELAEELATVYEEQRLKVDTLQETVRKLAEFELFWHHGSETPPIPALWRESMVINLSALPALKEIVAFLVIERLYREMSALPDAAIDPKTGARQIRTILVIDEAHNYLGRQNIFLERLIREGRSKGFAVFLSSQSPDDFDQKNFNYADLLQFVFVLRCNSASPRAVSELLRCSLEVAKSLVAELANLGNFECFSNNLTGSARSYTRFKAIPFYQAYPGQ